MRFGEIFSLSWKEYKQNFKVFTIIFLLLSIIPMIIQYLISIPVTLDALKLGTQETTQNIFAIFFSWKYLLVFIFGIITLLLSIWMLASFVYNALYRKKEMSIKQTLAGGKKYFWRFFGFYIVYCIFLALLFLLLIIPGIIFMIFWIFASYILIGENKGILDSLKTSRQIVKGRWWKVFGWFLLFGLIAAGISLVFSIVAGIINIAIGLPSLISGISQANIETLMSPSIIIITGFIKQISNSLAGLIIYPLGILFFKNFYLDMKKTSQVKKTQNI